jgi:hypothetical protein
MIISKDSYEPEEAVHQPSRTALSLRAPRTSSGEHFKPSAAGTKSESRGGQAPAHGGQAPAHGETTMFKVLTKLL